MPVDHVRLRRVVTHPHHQFPGARAHAIGPAPPLSGTIKRAVARGDDAGLVGIDASAQPRRQRDPLLRLVWFALGTANGLAVNILSGDYRWQAVGVTLFVAAIAMVAWVLRRRVLPESRIGRRAPAVLLALAVPAAAATLVEAWATPATLVAVSLVIIAILVPATLETTWRLLLGTALIGIGVAFIGSGAAALRGGNVLGGVLFIAVGMAEIGSGAAALHERDGLWDVTVVGPTVAAVGGGVAFLRDVASVAALGFGAVAVCFGAVVLNGGGDVLMGVAIIGFGVAAISSGAAMWRGSGVLWSVAGISLGLALLCLGVAVLRDGDVLMGVAFISFGVTALGNGAATGRSRGVLSSVAFISFGVAWVCVGVAGFYGGGVLAGASIIGFGGAAIGLAATAIHRSGVVKQLGSALIAWSQVPESRPTLRPKRYPGTALRTTPTKSTSNSPRATQQRSGAGGTEAARPARTQPPSR